MKISMHAMSHDVFKKALTQLLHRHGKRRRECQGAQLRNRACWSTRGSRPTCCRSPSRSSSPATSRRTRWRGSAGIDPPKFEDTETTMDELVARVKKTLDYIDTVPAARSKAARRATSRFRCATAPSSSRASRSCRHWAIAELLLPPRDRVQPAAPQRRGYRQARLPRRLSCDRVRRQKRGPACAGPLVSRIDQLRIRATGGNRRARRPAG